MDPALRIFTFYDEAIITASSAQATIRMCGRASAHTNLYCNKLVLHMALWDLPSLAEPICAKLAHRTDRHVLSGCTHSKKSQAGSPMKGGKNPVVVGLFAHWLGFGTRIAELKHPLATHISTQISSLSRGLSSKITFDEISAQNLSMSFPELIKFTNMMFKDVSFTRNEMRWFMMQAKSKPISSIEGNCHGDSEGDIKLLKYVEWLGCLIRMALALVGYGTLGLSPDEAVGRLAESMDLHNVLELQDLLYRIAHQWWLRRLVRP